MDKLLEDKTNHIEGIITMDNAAGLNKEIHLVMLNFRENLLRTLDPKKKWCYEISVKEVVEDKKPEMDDGTPFKRQPKHHPSDYVPFKAYNREESEECNCESYNNYTSWFCPVHGYHLGRGVEQTCNCKHYKTHYKIDPSWECPIHG